MKTKKLVTTRSVPFEVGKTFEVDTSDEACGRFGFKSCDRIYCKSSREEGVVVGVAPAMQGENPEPLVLWYALDSNGGRVSYSFPFEGDVVRA